METSVPPLELTIRVHYYNRPHTTAKVFSMAAVLSKNVRLGTSKSRKLVSLEQQIRCRTRDIPLTLTTGIGRFRESDVGETTPMYILP